MAKSDTTNVAYYFARRKDTGMAGVWFTHCASAERRENIIHRLITLAEHRQESVMLNPDDLLDARFRVCFLEEHFAKTVRDYCQNWGISIALSLHLQVLREAGHNIQRMP